MNKEKKFPILGSAVILLLIFVVIAGTILFINYQPKEKDPDQSAIQDLNTFDPSAEISKEVLELTSLEIEQDTSAMTKVYTEEVQSAVEATISDLKKTQYTFDDILAIMNPYYTNTTGLYLYFTTKEPLQLTYTIHTDNATDFTRTLNPGTDTGLTTEHEYQIIGLIPGVENEITLSLYDETGALANKKIFTCKAPDSLGKADFQMLNVTKGTSTEEVSEGLYTVLGNDIYEGDTSFVFLYDNEGNLRMEMPIISYRSHRMIFDENTMYLSIAADKMIGINKLGKVTKIYDTGDYTLHHDYIFNSEGNIWVLATKPKSGTQQDLIIEIDLDTGEIKEVLDLADLFGDYKKTTSIPEGKDSLDWMHINSIQKMEDDSILISSRETSSIIKISGMNSEPKIEYMLGSKDFWKESGYDSYVFDRDGDFILQSGQHSLSYAPDESLPEGQYYLHLYNNNNAISTTQPDFKWDEYDYYQGSGTGSKGDNSYYYKYLVDEKAKTFKLISKIDVAYSGYVSSAQEYKDNIIIDSGSQFTVYEYDKNQELIQKLVGTGERYYYRVYKYDYDGFWFQ
jgi:hypothetical protein